MIVIRYYHDQSKMSRLIRYLTYKTIIRSKTFNLIQKRFISDNDVLKLIRQRGPITRTSTRDSNISNVIQLIKDGKYKEADQLVIKNKIDINSHDRGENTPLTDAAHRGDTKAIKFLLTVQGINPHASCDCPFHKTALHYAVERGHYDAANLLLQNGAKPNVLDSRKYSALDIAKNDKIKKLLISHGGIRGKDVPINQHQQLNLPKANCQHQLK